MNDSAKRMQALLFYKAEPLEKQDLAKQLKISMGDVETAVEELTEALADTGLTLVTNGTLVELRTSPECSSYIEAITKEELTTPLSRPALETLSIIAYAPGVTRSEIDYVRGVNSQFILRNLAIRGLIERHPNPADKRSPLYRPSVEFLALLGVSSVEELPEQAEIIEKVRSIMSSDKDHEGDQGIQ